MRVFLAEDNAAVREQMTQFLRPLLGVEIVYTATTQMEAIGWLHAHPHGWDLAVVDLFLAQGNGFAILRHCASRTSRQKVVLMSGYARDPVRDRALAEGADAFFDKSTQMAELFDFCLETGRSLGSS